MPSSLSPELTTACTMRCGYCCWDLASEREADVASLARLLQEAKLFYASHIAFTGGEPLLHSGLADVLAVVERNGYTCGFVTTGSGVGRHEGLLRRYARSLRFVAIGLDSVEDPSPPLPGVADLVRFALERGAASVRFTTPSACAASLANGLVPGREERRTLFAEICRARTQWPAFPIWMSPQIPGSDELLCCVGLGMGSLDFDVDSNLVFCGALSRNALVDQEAIRIGSFSAESTLQRCAAGSPAAIARVCRRKLETLSRGGDPFHFFSWDFCHAYCAAPGPR